MDADLTELYQASTTHADRLAVLNAQAARDNLEATRSLQLDVDSVIALGSEARLRRDLAVALAPNYMKPSTATTLAGQQADAARDGQWLRFAIDEAVKAARGGA
jgi:hypothetical protein